MSRSHHRVMMDPRAKSRHHFRVAFGLAVARVVVW